MLGARGGDLEIIHHKNDNKKNINVFERLRVCLHSQLIFQTKILNKHHFTGIVYLVYVLILYKEIVPFK